MKRPLIVLLLLAGFIPAFSYGQTQFRSAKSGGWCNDHSWEQEQNGIWLRADHGSFPGEAHQRKANVTIGDGDDITINEGEEVHINSLTVLDGRILVNGILVIGPDENDSDDIISQSEEPVVSEELSLPNQSTPPTDGLQLLQNIPNPVFSAHSNSTVASFYLDANYPNVRLSLYDQLGREVRRIFDEVSPTVGWHSLRITTDELESGSYNMVLQAGGIILRRTMSVIK